MKSAKRICASKHKAYATTIATIVLGRQKERASDDGRYRDTDRVIGCHINRNANKGRYMTNE